MKATRQISKDQRNFKIVQKRLNEIFEEMLENKTDPKYYFAYLVGRFELRKDLWERYTDQFK